MLTSDRFVMGRPLSQQNPHYNCYIIPLDRGMDPIIAHLPEEYALALGASYQAPFAQGPKDLHAHVGPVASAFGVQFVNKAMTMQLWQGSNDMEFTIPLILQVESDPNKDVLKPLSALYELMLPRENTPGGLMTSPGPYLDLEALKQSIRGQQTVNKVASEVLWNSEEGKSSVLGSAATGATTTGWAAVTGAASTIGEASMSDATADTIGAAGEAIRNTYNAGNNALAAMSNSITSAIKYNIMLMIGEFQLFPSVVITNVQQTTKVRPDYITGTMTRIEVAVTFKTFYTPTNLDLPNLLLGTQSQWNETTQPAPESSQQGMKTDAAQPTPINSTDSSERVSLSESAGEGGKDPMSYALHKSAWS